MGSDLFASLMHLLMSYFNPRSPHGERLLARNLARSLTKISIHAPRMGSDMLWLVIILLIADFNPRSPHGERQLRYFACGEYGEFQSTLPAWGATVFEMWSC